MITKAQTDRLVSKLEAHRESLKEVLDGLIAHAAHNEDAIASLRLAVKHLDDAADYLGGDPS